MKCGVCLLFKYSREEKNFFIETLDFNDSNVNYFLQSVTVHTDIGDIKIELFCEQCPKSCENFLYVEQE